MDKRKKLFIIIGVIVVVFIILFIVLFSKDDNDTPSIGNIDKVIEEDIKKDNEKGIVLTNLNNAFILEEGKKTEEFVYNFHLNNENINLKFKNMVLNNKEKPSKITMYMNDKEINIMEIINDTTFKTPTSIIPKFYILGENSNEILLIEIIANDEEIPYNTYIALNNDGEVRNSFGGYDNNKISDTDFIKAIKNGTLIYDHRISNQEYNAYCACNELKKGYGINKVISEKQTFSVLESSLKLESNELYECKTYCK